MYVIKNIVFHVLFPNINQSEYSISEISIIRIINNWIALNTNCEILRLVRSSQKLTQKWPQYHTHMNSLPTSQIHINPHRKKNLLERHEPRLINAPRWQNCWGGKKPNNKTTYAGFWPRSRHGLLMCWLVNHLNLRDLHRSTSFIRKTELRWEFMLFLCSWIFVDRSTCSQQLLLKSIGNIPRNTIRVHPRHPDTVMLLQIWGKSIKVNVVLHLGFFLLKVLSWHFI